jgi:hypothetical protein
MRLEDQLRHLCQELRSWGNDLAKEELDPPQRASVRALLVQLSSELTVLEGLVTLPEQGGRVRHVLRIFFEPKDDAEAQRILENVEALGFEIEDVVETKGMTLGQVIRRTPEELERRRVRREEQEDS